MVQLRNRTGLAMISIAAGAYVTVWRPWQLAWGATSQEVADTVAGDDLVQKPWFNATRAITVHASPDRIWPWLIQVGVSRAGWYSYDLLDNLGRPSAQRIIPELQQLAEGDTVPMSPDGRQGMTVHSMAAPHSMVWSTPGETSWAWQLDERPGGTTRLITRIRSRPRRHPMSVAFFLLVEVADFWMIRKMLLSVRERAERPVS
jgi:hypothetical protein